MTLHEKFLPNAQYQSKVGIQIKATAKEIYPLLESLDFSDARITALLFRLRGIPVPMGMTLHGLQKVRFVVLESVKNKGFILGLIGQFWTPSGKLLIFKPEDFSGFNDRRFAKAIWEFRLIEEQSSTRLETITSIEYLSERSKKRFKWYWMIIKPFSNFIRYEILRSVKRKLNKR